MQFPNNTTIVVTDGQKFRLFRNTGTELHLTLTELPVPSRVPALCLRCWLECGFTDEVFLDVCLRSDVGKDASANMETESAAPMLANGVKKERP